MTDDHTIKIKRTGVDPEIEEEKRGNVEASKIANFDWSDDDSLEDDSELPSLTMDVSDIDNCCEKLVEHIFKNLSTECFRGDDVEGLRFVLDVNPDLHLSLSERFSDEWNLESRLLVFQVIRDALTAEFIDESLRKRLDDHISSIMPPSYRKKFVSGDVLIFDDAIAVDDDINTICIEIPVNFEANKRKST